MSFLPRTRALVDAVIPLDDDRARIARDVLLIVGFSLFVAVMARFSVHLPFTPVPITGQTLGVLLTGAALGSWRGGAALTLYLVEGTQFPVFAGGAADYLWQASMGGSVLGFTTGSAGLFWQMASGGYIIGFIPAAFLVGYLCERGWDRRPWIVLAMLSGNVMLYVPGLIQLSLFVPGDKVLTWGLYPFIVGDLIKLAIAAGLLPAAWALLGLRSQGRPTGSRGDAS